MRGFVRKDLDTIKIVNAFTNNNRNKIAVLKSDYNPKC